MHLTGGGFSMVLFGFLFAHSVLKALGTLFLSFSAVIILSIFIHFMFKCRERLWIVLVHFIVALTSKDAREKELPYLGFLYRTTEGWLSRGEIQRRMTGPTGARRKEPGPNHFFWCLEEKIFIFFSPVEKYFSIVVTDKSK